MDIVAVDLGGTNARFAITRIENGRVVAMGDIITLETAQHETFNAAWRHFAAICGRPLPRAAAIAVACPVNGQVITLTNCSWEFRSDSLLPDLVLDTVTLVNDFGAVGYAVGHLAAEHLQHVSGPDQPLPDSGLISIVGPGTGLGVAQVLRCNGQAHVIETEGGHSDFAPLDAIDEAILAHFRQRHGRVSIERIVSGPGLLGIYETLVALEGAQVRFQDDKTLWGAALEGRDMFAVLALDRFCLTLGAVAGDIALTQGAAALVLAGGIGLRLADRLSRSGFASRFAAKGRFEKRMMALPVKVITHPHVGLIGAAAAFAKEHDI